MTTSSTFGLLKNPGYDPNGRTTQGLYQVDTPPGWTPTAPSDVVQSWTPALTKIYGEEVHTDFFHEKR